MADANSLEQLKVQAAQAGCSLIVVDSSMESWNKLLNSCEEAYRLHEEGKPVILVIEEEEEEVAGDGRAAARNFIRDGIRGQFQESPFVSAFACMEDALFDFS